MDLSLGYSVILLPALWGLALATTFTFLFKGIRRTTHEVEGVDIGKWGYDSKWLRRAGLVALVAAIVLPAIVVTPPGHRAVIFQAAGGVNMTERVEGVSFIPPYFNTAKQINVREHIFFTDEAFSQSSDLQEITVHVAVGHRIEPTLAAELYQEVGMDYEKILIEPAVFQFVKQEVGLILAEDFATNREVLAEAIREQLAAELGRNGIVVTYVSIVDAIFDPQFISAVKDKVIADQVADEQVRLVAAETARKNQVEQQSLAEKIRLENEGAGAAAFIAAIADALGFTPEEYLRWQLVNQWDGQMPTTVVGDSAGGLIFDLAQE